jgi:AraC-like DNA-binding protein
MNSTFYRHPFQGNLSEEQKIKVYERSTPSVSTHWHDFYELELILEGTGIMNVNGTEHPLAPNTLYLLTPTDLHSYHVEPGQELTLINITFSPDCIQDLTITEMITLTQYIFTKLDDRTAARMIFLMRQMKEECSGEGFLHQKYTTGLMSCILVELLRCYKKEQTTNQIPEMRSLPLPVQNALYYIRLHFRENITLKEVAQLSGFSEHYMSKLFHHNFGMGFKEYLISLRLDHAKQLLLYSEDSVTDIAYFCGFNSSSHFLHVFKDTCGTSPLQYRKQHRGSK